jgi:hypothetical protein
MPRIGDHVAAVGKRRRHANTSLHARDAVSHRHGRAAGIPLTSPYAHAATAIGVDIARPFDRGVGDPRGPGGWWILLVELGRRWMPRREPAVTH